MASAAEVKEFRARCLQLTNHPVWPSVPVLRWSNALRSSMWRQQEKVCRYTHTNYVRHKMVYRDLTQIIEKWFPCNLFYLLNVKSPPLPIWTDLFLSKIFQEMYKEGHYFPCYNICFRYIYFLMNSTNVYIKIPVHTF